MIDFAIIGAQKSGTSALAHFLGQHPAIAMSQPKEPHVFDAEDYKFDTIESKYGPFFEGAGDGQMRGEATPIYLFLPNVIEELWRYNEKLKVIVLLRDPVDRAISHYEMARERGEESLPLWCALLAEFVRLRCDKTPIAAGSSTRNRSYRTRGYYSRQLEHLFQYFKTDQVLIMPMERLLKDHNGALKAIFSFLGVDINCEIPREIVFSKGSDKRFYPISRLILKACYLLEYSRVKRFIEAF